MFDNYIRLPIGVKIHNFRKIFWKYKKYDGVNIVGFSKGDFGLGDHMRLVSKSFLKTDFPFCINNSDMADHNPNENTELDHLIEKQNKYLLNLFCFNADFIIRYMTRVKNEILKTQYNIGYGYWELSVFPKQYQKQFKFLNEVWAPSKYLYDVLKNSTDLPVFHMPIPIEFEIPSNFTRKDFNLPENQFLFIFSFDMSSITKRKNPEAVIECFKKAFPDENMKDVGLVIKLQRNIKNARTDALFAELQSKVSQNNIHIIDEILTREKMYGLLNCCDAYVSLHRSEGFGLGMAEAMKMGKCVIGTAYSGNMDFMNEDNSCLVPFELIKVEISDYIFVQDGAVWAEPDKEKAIYYMKKLYEDKDYRNQISKNGQEYINKYHSFEYISEKYKERLSKCLEIQKSQVIKPNKLKNFIIGFYENVIIKSKNFFKYRVYNFKNNFNKEIRPNGVNIIGDIRGEYGIAEHMRFVTNTFRRSNLDFCINDFGKIWNGTNTILEDLIEEKSIYNVNLYCLNGTEVVTYRNETRNDVITTQYNIAYGYWEVSKFPQIFQKQFKYVDELWAASTFIQKAISETTDLPVYYMPISVDFEIPNDITRKNFNLPEDLFLYMFSFNLYSHIKRKNPQAVIECFLKAFDDQNADAGLVIKIIGDKTLPTHNEKFKKLQNLAKDRKIFFIFEELNREKMLGLINCCDVYVSLHRGEGFGLGMAEAMKMGKNVIGTAYSGNMDFMNEDNSCLVPYTLIDIQKGEYLYFEKGTQWADPDIEQAVYYMKKLYEDKEYRDRLRKNAQAYMDKYHSFEYIAKKYEERMTAIHQKLNEK
jgi:glycosyltransferase involved in cell wall biosynthesis